MEQSPSWETNQFSASQEILRVLRNPKVHYRIHKCPPPDYPEPARSSPSPIFHFLRIHFNIILPNMPGPLKWFLSLSFHHQNPEYASPPPKRATFPAHLILLDCITRTISGEQYRSLSSSLCSVLHCPVTSSLLGPNIPLNTLFSDTLSLRSSFNVSWTTKFHTHNKQREKL